MLKCLFFNNPNLKFNLNGNRHEEDFIRIDACTDPKNVTGKSFSEVLILASINPQYDKRLSIELTLQYMKIPNLEHGENMKRT